TGPGPGPPRGGRPGGEAPRTAAHPPGGGRPDRLKAPAGAPGSCKVPRPFRVTLPGAASVGRPTNPHRRVMTEAPLNHPTAEELRALSLGQLTDAELARVSAHLADCPACCRRIDQ